MYVNTAGGLGLVVAGLLVPILPLPLPVPRTMDFAGRVRGRWRNPNFVQLSSDGALFRIGFGPGNRPDRIRFGNPQDNYGIHTAGQWREFNVPVPFGSNQVPLDRVLVGGTVLLPREV